MRDIVIAANWKMHKTRDEARAFVAQYEQFVQGWIDDADHLQVVFAPPATLLDTLNVELNVSAGVFAQTMHEADSGAYTGELSALMLKDLDLDGVLLGHSERRAYYNETDEALAEKVAQAIRHELRPMLCVGESIEQRRAGTAEATVEAQLRTGLRSVDAAGAEYLYIAYEPVWAIGTGETATPDIAQKMHAYIRSVLADIISPEQAERIPVLYGGSVKPDNIAELLAQPDIDGALVGGASLEFDDFKQLVAAGRDAYAATTA